MKEIVDRWRLKEITPIEIHDSLYLKREDLFKPFEDVNVNGTKLRQCAYLILKNLEQAKNGVITCCSIHSPQGAITSALCRDLGIKCTIFYGGTTYEKLATYKNQQLIAYLGGNMEIVTKMGRMSVLHSIARKRQETTHEFIVEHGVDLMNNIDCFLDSVAWQVQNLPNDLDNLIITCGSGISTTGILYGLKLYNKNVKNIILVGVAPNRTDKVKNNLKTLSEITNLHLNDIEFKYIDLFNTKGFRYEKEVKAEHCGIILHPNYEAKTYKWIVDNVDFKNEKTCFWIVGANALNN